MNEKVYQLDKLNMRFLAKYLATSKDYPSIEGLRGTLALVVCCGHFGFGTVLSQWGLAFNLHFAVDLFFIISGLVLAYSNYYAPRSISGGEFIIKRIARLYPLHVLTLFLMCVLNIIRDLPTSGLDVLKNLFLLHNVGLGAPSNALNFPSWSISVEFWASLLLFFITALIKNRFIISILAIGYVLACCTLCSSYFITGGYEAALGGFLNVGLLRGVAGTFMGILIYFALNSPTCQKLWQNIFCKYISLLGLGWFFLQNPPAYSMFLFYLLSFYFIGALCQSNFLRIFRHPLALWLGTVSYSIYLLHIPLYQLLQLIGGNAAVKGIWGKLILLPTLLVLAHLSFFLFEQPMQRKLKKLLSNSDAFLKGDVTQTN